MLEEVGNECSLIVNSEVGCNISKQPAIGPVFGDLIQIIEFKDENDLNAYPVSKEHQRLLKGPEMETVHCYRLLHLKASFKRLLNVYDKVNYKEVHQ